MGIIFWLPRQKIILFNLPLPHVEVRKLSVRDEWQAQGHPESPPLCTLVSCPVWVLGFQALFSLALAGRPCKLSLPAPRQRLEPNGSSAHQQLHLPRSVLSRAAWSGGPRPTADLQPVPKQGRLTPQL